MQAITLRLLLNKQHLFKHNTGLLSRPTNVQHIYKHILYIVSTSTCFDTSASCSGSLNFYFAKVTKIIMVTNSIK